MSTGWQCRKCGYEPDHNELADGSCPDCGPSDREFKRGLPGRLKDLPIGSCVWVWKWSWTDRSMIAGSERPYQYQRTRYVFEAIGRFEDGSLKWRNVRGRFNMLMDDGETVKAVNGVSLGPLVWEYYDLDALTTRSVAHFASQELCYGSEITIHDPYTQPAPTRFDLARERILEAVGMTA